MSFSNKVLAVYILNYRVFSALFQRIDLCYDRCDQRKSNKAIFGRDGFIISQLRLNYTSEMEKAMYAAHGVGFETYSRRHKVRMKIEKARQQNYLHSQRMIADLDRRVHA
ncbi:hypothetical protein [Bacillus coreaensis]